MLIMIEPLTDEGAFQAGRAFEVHRARRQAGAAKSILADFFIGGHAQAAGATILTRDPRFYRSYFPGRSEERRVGKACVVRVDFGGRRIIKKKKKIKAHQKYTIIINRI